MFFGCVTRALESHITSVTATTKIISWGCRERVLCGRVKDSRMAVIWVGGGRTAGLSVLAAVLRLLENAQSALAIEMHRNREASLGMQPMFPLVRSGLAMRC